MNQPRRRTIVLSHWLTGMLVAAEAMAARTSEATPPAKPAATPGSGVKRVCDSQPHAENHNEDQRWNGITCLILVASEDQILARIIARVLEELRRAA